MNDNYAPPRANLDQSDEAKLSGSKSWFSSRPIPVYLIFLVSFFQIIAPAYLTFDGWHVLSQMFEAGVR